VAHADAMKVRCSGGISWLARWCYVVGEGCVEVLWWCGGGWFSDEGC